LTNAPGQTRDRDWARQFFMTTRQLSSSRHFRLGLRDRALDLCYNVILPASSDRADAARSMLMPC